MNMLTMPGTQQVIILVSRVRVWMHVTETQSKRGSDTPEVYLRLPLKSRCRVFREGTEMWDPYASGFPLCCALNEVLFLHGLTWSSSLTSTFQGPQAGRRQEKTCPAPKGHNPEVPFHWLKLSHVATPSCNGIWKMQNGKCWDFYYYRKGGGQPATLSRCPINICCITIAKPARHSSAFYIHNLLELSSKPSRQVLLLSPFY